jgi:aminodeoxyfutalosine deaminase
LKTLIHSKNTYIDEKINTQDIYILTNKEAQILSISASPITSNYETKIETESLLCPAFVNTHCHTELSYLKNKIEPHIGLHNFIVEIEKHKTNDENTITLAANKAIEEMYNNGIELVGDISNTNFISALKQNSYLQFHTFIELYAFDPQKSNIVFERGKQLQNNFFDHNSSIVPHAPYSVSEPLALKIIEYAIAQNAVLSYHNQESQEEDELFFSKSGKIIERLHSFGIDTSLWTAPKKNSIEYFYSFFSPLLNTILVHNTYTKQEQIDWAMQHNPKTYWAFCPNANLYIENKLPNINLFLKHSNNLCIGTDSLASNYTLSILDEIKTLKNNFSILNTSTLLKFATINGAKALKKDTLLGSFEINKKPGFIRLNNLENFEITNSTTVERLNLANNKIL